MDMAGLCGVLPAANARPPGVENPIFPIAAQKAFFEMSGGRPERIDYRVVSKGNSAAPARLRFPAQLL
jgi:hypothetical protein